MSSSDSDSQSSVADAAVGGFSGMAFNLDGHGNLVPVHVGAPGNAPSAELLSLDSTLMPFLANRMQQNQARGNMETDKAGGSGNMEIGKADGSGNMQTGKADGSGSTMMVEGGGYEASSSTTTAMAQADSKNDGNKKQEEQDQEKQGWQEEVVRGFEI